MRAQARLENQSKAEIIRYYTEITSIVQTGNIDRIVVALDERRGKFPIDELLSCRLRGVKVDDGVAFTEYLAGKLSVESLHPSCLIFSDGFKSSSTSKILKRIIDVSVSSFGLLAFSLVGLIIGIAIKLDSKGPIFYRQERVGEGGKTFRLLKFRSMQMNAEANGPQWAKANDDRVTRVGRIIRKLRLDEMPQMINVLKGEMSFVGPRPERPMFVERLTKGIPFYCQRHVVRPGITGWAQICYPYGASREDALEKLKYDLYYIKHISLLFDLIIIFETIKVVLFSKGAR